MLSLFGRVLGTLLAVLLLLRPLTLLGVTGSEPLPYNQVGGAICLGAAVNVEGFGFRVQGLGLWVRWACLGSSRLLDKLVLEQNVLLLFHLNVCQSVAHGLDKSGQKQVT